ncbi:MAG: 16S rRNA (cytidine(1402)-2'-O)-methyltransferase [Pseudomonadota bacterium]
MARQRHEGRDAGDGDAAGPDVNGSTGRGPARRAAILPGLHLVATPIGNARDITLRALDTLAGCDAIAAEDTRVTMRLMEMHGIARADRPMIAYHDRNAAEARPRLMRLLAEGRAVAYCSDAGTPLVADPGFRLVGAAIAEDVAVHALPGPSAALAALAVSGLPSDRFLFAGFPPSKSGSRRRFLSELAAVPATLILFESPHRVVDSVADMARILGAARDVALARELTKRFETVRRMTLGTLAETLAHEGAPKGEIVLVLGPPLVAEAPSDAEIDAAIDARLAYETTRDAAAAVAAVLGLPRRQIYARALERARVLGKR